MLPFFSSTFLNGDLIKRNGDLIFKREFDMRLDSDGVMLYPSSYIIKVIFWQDQMGCFTAHYGLAMISKGIQDAQVLYDLSAACQSKVTADHMQH